jgi:2'-5' RNA ligase
LPGARWIDPENYHVTLRFIGDVDDRTAHEAAYALEGVARQALDLRIEGLSSFGGNKPRALVATVAPTRQLLELQAEHERLMQRVVGLEPEGRKYTPHVTLARLRDTSSRDVADYLAARPYRSQPFRVSRFVLMSARASVGGGPYLVEAEYPLAAKLGAA